MSSDNTRNGEPDDRQAKAQAKEADRLARRAATSSRMREKIEKQLQREEQQRQQEARVQRLEIARQGISALSRDEPGEATKYFLVYLKALERAKKVESGRLTPSVFDAKTEMAEMVLLTGVYWDLARIYDRTRGKENVQKLQFYLNQYVYFAKDATYKALCAETLRKFLVAEKALHRGEFKAAYKRLGGTTCFIASSLMDLSGPETMPRLRRFRDHFLLRNSWGRRMVHFYESVSPALAAKLDAAPHPVRWLLARTLDGVACLLSRR